MSCGSETSSWPEPTGASSYVSAPPPGRARRPARAPARCTGPRGCALRIPRGTVLIVDSTGVAAASPNAHSVLPMMLLATESSRSRSRICAFAALDLAEQPVQPVAALAARRALAARLVLVEVQQVLRRPHHARRLVHDDDAGRPEHATRPWRCRRSWRECRSDPAAAPAPTSRRESRLQLVAAADAAGELRRRRSGRAATRPSTLRRCPGFLT